jgi:hypothetical protein
MPTSHFNPDKKRYKQALDLTYAMYTQHVKHKPMRWTVEQAVQDVEPNRSPGYPYELKYKSKGAYFASPSFATDQAEYWETLLTSPRQEIL